MKIVSPLPHKRARIEIIPLIDIMFFLLASFMLASLSMIKLQSVEQMQLPSASSAKRVLKPDLVNVGVDKAGDVYIDKTKVDMAELRTVLSNRFRGNTNVPIYISGDRATAHANIVRVLETVRAVGIQQVSFSISPPAAKQP